MTGKIFLLLFVFLIHHALAELPSYAKAQETAKKNGKDLLVLLVGSDWLKDSDLYKQTFERIAPRTLGKEILFCVYDERAGLSKEEREHLGKLPFTINAYPAWIYCDAQGHPIDHRENVTLKEISLLPKRIAELSTLRKQRDKAFARAEKCQGIERAKLIGQALSETLDPVIETFSIQAIHQYQKSYDDLIKKIKEADPEDRTGYVYKFTFTFLSLQEEVVQKYAKTKEYDQCYNDIREKLKNKTLTPKQRQYLYLANYATSMKAENLERALTDLETAAKIAPKSPLSDECKRLIAYHTEPVRLTGMRWTPADNRPQWTPMLLDVSSSFPEKGKYSVRFEHRKGRTLFKNLTLLTGEKTIAQINEQSNSFQIQLPRGLRNKKVTLKIEAQGTGWFSGCGDILIERMKE